jgi:hypothetical protein
MSALQFSASSDAPEPVAAMSVSYRGTAHADKMPGLDSTFPHSHRGEIFR